MKIYILIFLATSSIFISSCEDQLEISPSSSFTASNFYKNANDLEQVVVSAYAFLQSEGQYDENFHFFMEVSADHSIEIGLGTRGGNFGQFEIFNINTTNSVLNETWSDCYKGIQSCNIVLNRIDAIEDMNEDVKKTRKGEVQFLRALTYFNLVRIWGSVPLVLDETQNPFDAFEQGKAGIPDIYDQIVKDLSAAAENLPATQSDIGRATSGAANALLGKVYLTLGDDQDAITALNKVTGYSLMSNYAQVFGPDNENNDESIFEVQFTGGIGSEGSSLTNLFTPLGGNSIAGGVGTPSGHNVPSLALFNKYDASDRRRDVTIGEINGTRYANKYITVPKGSNDSDVNVIVLRYADVLLMKAEALNEVGYVPDGEAFGLLNQIRNRAGLSSLTSTELPDQSSFRLAIEDERVFELSFELHRWFDLKRTGRTLEVMNSSSQETEPFVVQEHHLVFPIPQIQVDTNPDKITQNPNY